MFFRLFFASLALRCHQVAKATATSTNKAGHLIAVIVSAFALMSVAAFPARASIVYVAQSGSSTASCQTIATACNNILSALTFANDGDVIRCVGPVQLIGSIVITKGVSIECALGGGGINTQSIQINAPGKNVTIRNVAVNCLGFCIGNGGIDIVAAATVALENVSVEQSSTIGIYDHRTGGQTKLFIKDTSVRNSVGAGIVAVSAATGTTVLDNVTSENNTYGIAVGAGNNVAIRNSVFSGNSATGVEGDPGAQIMLDGSTVTHNNIGVVSASSVRLSNNDIGFNTTAISGSAATFGNNRLSGNGSIGTAPIALGGASSDLGQQ